MDSALLRKLATELETIVNREELWFLPLPEIGMPSNVGKNVAFLFNAVLKQWDAAKLKLCANRMDGASEMLQGKVDGVLGDIKALWNYPPKPGTINLRALNGMRRLTALVLQLADEIDMPPKGKPSKQRSSPKSANHDPAAAAVAKLSKQMPDGDRNNAMAIIDALSKAGKRMDGKAIKSMVFPSRTTADKALLAELVKCQALNRGKGGYGLPRWPK